MKDGYKISHHFLLTYPGYRNHVFFRHENFDGSFLLWIYAERYSKPQYFHYNEGTASRARLDCIQNYT